MPGSRGPKISPQIKRYIVVEALKDKHIPRKILAEELKEKIDNSGMGRSPSPETLEKLISKARNHELHSEDKPWTLVRSSEITADAIPVVLRLWKQQLNLFGPQLPFTIRQAKWITRLYKVITDDLLLITWSNLYAIQESASDLLGVDLDSEVFDAALVMGPWEFLTALWTGAVKLTESTEGFPLQELVQLSKYRGISIKEELDGVTELWIKFLSKGPKWRQFDEAKQEELRVRLRLWVLEHPWSEDTSWLSWFEYEEGLTIEQFQSHRLLNASKIVLEEFASNPLFKPEELLEEVGYSIDVLRTGGTK